MRLHWVNPRVGVLRDSSGCFTRSIGHIVILLLPWLRRADLAAHCRSLTDTILGVAKRRRRTARTHLAHSRVHVDDLLHSRLATVFGLWTNHEQTCSYWAPILTFLVGRQFGVGPSLTTMAFVGTNPAGELITSGLPVIGDLDCRVPTL
jgi:hypothetical protein